VRLAAKASDWLEKGARPLGVLPYGCAVIRATASIAFGYIGQRGTVVKILYAVVVGFVATSMVIIVDRYETNRILARILTAIVYLTGTLAILAKLG